MKRALLVVFLAACGSTKAEVAAPPAPAPVTVPPRDPVDLAHDLALLATGVAATSEDLDTLAKANHSHAAYAAYVETLLKRPGVPKVATSVLRITGALERSIISMGTLKQEGDVYYTHEPCDPATAVTVKPWWALDTTVRVCPSSYRPDVFADAEGNFCSGLYAGARNAKTPCGCGPNLMRCVRSDADRDAFKKAIAAEAQGTLAWIVQNDLPLQTLFTSVESFRGPHAELLYQRWKVENRDVPSLEALPDWRAWPEKGRWAPRLASKPDQHAGIFTNHFTPQMADSQRMKLVQFMDILWCESPDSLRVKTETVLEFAEKSGSNLRGTVAVGPGQLSERALCMDCHARMDHGVQFFQSLQWHYKALHYVATAQTDATGALYFRDISDPRGKAPLNPQGFVKLALAQPEFPSCMAKNFVRHAFASPTEPAAVALDAKLQAIVERKGTYREMLKTALDAYVADALAGGIVQGAASPQTNAQRASAVAALVADKCGDCHGEGDEAPARIGKLGAQWCAKGDCAKLGVDVLNAVVFDRMPKEAPLAVREKEQLFEWIAPLAWPDATARAMARRYFIEYTLAPRTHRLDAMMSWIHTHGGADKAQLPPVSPEPKFSVSSAAELGITAAKACAGEADRKACLDKAMQAHAFEK